MTTNHRCRWRRAGPDLAKRNRTVFRCRDCGEEYPRWAGKCQACGTWNSIEEVDLPPSGPGGAIRTGGSSTLLPLSEISGETGLRIPSGIPDLDAVLGGGFVPGSFLLIAGEPGVGKSTLMIEAVRNLQGTVHYYSGEESPAQVKMRCSRMGFDSPGFLLSRETDLDSIVGKILEDRPILAIVDSIQTVQRPGAGSGPGSPGQMREAAMALLEACKTAGSILIVTGHVTKDGAIAGPRILEHMVDTVLYFETDRLNHYRFLRAVKNRFGPVGETAVFEMIQSGLRIVSEIHPDGERGPSASGRVYSVIHHGSRAMTVEVQALVVRAAYGPSRRMADGMDTRRLILISAVLEKFLKIHLSDCDIFANLAGGLSSDEPGLDLALAAAILSSFREVVVDPRMAFVGELGLSGEVRSVSGMDRRIRELAGSGFRKLVVPPIQDHWKELAGETELLSVEHVYQLPGISTGEGEPVDLKKSGLLS